MNKRKENKLTNYFLIIPKKKNKLETEDVAIDNEENTINETDKEIKLEDSIVLDDSLEANKKESTNKKYYSLFNKKWEMGSNNLSVKQLWTYKELTSTPYPDKEYYDYYFKAVYGNESMTDKKEEENVNDDGKKSDGSKTAEDFKFNIKERKEVIIVEKEIINDIYKNEDVYNKKEDNVIDGGKESERNKAIDDFKFDVNKKKGIVKSEKGSVYLPSFETMFNLFQQNELYSNQKSIFSSFNKNTNSNKDLLNNFSAQKNGGFINNKDSIIKIKTWLSYWKLIPEDNTIYDDNEEEEIYNEMMNLREKIKENEEEDYGSRKKKSKKKITKEKKKANKMEPFLLIYGSHGVGKTSCIYLCAEECNYQILEINSTNKRSNKELNQLLLELSNNHLVKKNHTNRLLNGSNKSNKKSNLLILIEEVDILFSSDKNFLSSLIQIANLSKRPFILISNDSINDQIPKTMVYKNIKFKPWNEQQLILFLQLIGLKYQKIMELNCIKKLIYMLNFDIRRILSYLNVYYLNETTDNNNESNNVLKDSSMSNNIKDGNNQLNIQQLLKIFNYEITTELNLLNELEFNTKYTILNEANLNLTCNSDYFTISDEISNIDDELYNNKDDEDELFNNKDLELGFIRNNRLYTSNKNTLDENNNTVNNNNNKVNNKNDIRLDSSNDEHEEIDIMNYEELDNNNIIKLDRNNKNESSNGNNDELNSANITQLNNSNNSNSNNNNIIGSDTDINDELVKNSDSKLNVDNNSQVNSSNNSGSCNNKVDLNNITDSNEPNFGIIIKQLELDSINDLFNCKFESKYEKYLIPDLCHNTSNYYHWDEINDNTINTHQCFNTEIKFGITNNYNQLISEHNYMIN
ncbi:hypothetical protein K502DRAFT_339554 [Neoconidiobolus thromboides FSU 785]|nr:hypothetical protein K502DRAFT_339554 [Neoconidiobolus thromboides FSU 785]